MARFQTKLIVIRNVDELRDDDDIFWYIFILQIVRESNFSESCATEDFTKCS